MRVCNSADGYAHGLNALLEDDDGRTRLGQEGRAYAAATFDPRVMEQRMVELYEEFVVGR
jgi:glycosyltransferase involved in cell wall biosynthesis